MLRGLGVNQAASALGVKLATVRQHIKLGELKANKCGAKWQVFLPGQGCELCTATGHKTILARCATCRRYICGYHSVSACNDRDDHKRAGPHD